MLKRFAPGVLALVVCTSLALADTPKNDGTTLGNPLKGTIVKVDRTHNTITVDINGTPTEYTVDPATQFVGPNKGVAPLGIKDDRVAPGASVSIVVTGHVLRVIHLPYRHRIGK